MADKKKKLGGDPKTTQTAKDDKTIASTVKSPPPSSDDDKAVAAVCDDSDAVIKKATSTQTASADISPFEFGHHENTAPHWAASKSKRIETVPEYWTPYEPHPLRRIHSSSVDPPTPSPLPPSQPSPSATPTKKSSGNNFFSEFMSNPFIFPPPSPPPHPPCCMNKYPQCCVNIDQPTVCFPLEHATTLYLPSCGNQAMLVPYPAVPLPPNMVPPHPQPPGPSWYSPFPPQMFYPPTPSPPPLFDDVFRLQMPVTGNKFPSSEELNVSDSTSVPVPKKRRPKSRNSKRSRSRSKRQEDSSEEEDEERKWSWSHPTIRRKKWWTKYSKTPLSAKGARNFEDPFREFKKRTAWQDTRDLDKDIEYDNMESELPRQKTLGHMTTLKMKARPSTSCVNQCTASYQDCVDSCTQCGSEVFRECVTTVQPNSFRCCKPKQFGMNSSEDNELTEVNATVIRKIQLSLKSSKNSQKPKTKKFNVSVETVRLLSSFIRSGNVDCTDRRCAINVLPPLSCACDKSIAHDSCIGNQRQRKMPKRFPFLDENDICKCGPIHKNTFTPFLDYENVINPHACQDSFPFPRCTEFPTCPPALRSLPFLDRTGDVLSIGGRHLQNWLKNFNQEALNPSCALSSLQCRHLKKLMQRFDKDLHRLPCRCKETPRRSRPCHKLSSIAHKTYKSACKSESDSLLLSDGNRNKPAGLPKEAPRCLCVGRPISLDKKCGNKHGACKCCQECVQSILDNKFCSKENETMPTKCRPCLKTRMCSLQNGCKGQRSPCQSPKFTSSRRHMANAHACNKVQSTGRNVPCSQPCRPKCCTKKETKDCPKSECKRLQYAESRHGGPPLVDTCSSTTANIEDIEDYFEYYFKPVPRSESQNSPKSTDSDLDICCSKKHDCWDTKVPEKPRRCMCDPEQNEADTIKCTLPCEEICLAKGQINETKVYEDYKPGCCTSRLKIVSKGSSLEVNVSLSQRCHKTAITTLWSVPVTPIANQVHAKCCDLKCSTQQEKNYLNEVRKMACVSKARQHFCKPEGENQQKTTVSKDRCRRSCPKTKRLNEDDNSPACCRENVCDDGVTEQNCGDDFAVCPEEQKPCGLPTDDPVSHKKNGHQAPKCKERSEVCESAAMNKEWNRKESEKGKHHTKDKESCDTPLNKAKSEKNDSLQEPKCRPCNPFDGGPCLRNPKTKDTPIENRCPGSSTFKSKERDQRCYENPTTKAENEKRDSLEVPGCRPCNPCDEGSRVRIPKTKDFRKESSCPDGGTGKNKVRDQGCNDRPVNGDESQTCDPHDAPEHEPCNPCDGGLCVRKSRRENNGLGRGSTKADINVKKKSTEGNIHKSCTLEDRKNKGNSSDSLFSHCSPSWDNSPRKSKRMTKDRITDGTSDEKPCKKCRQPHEESGSLHNRAKRQNPSKHHGSDGKTDRASRHCNHSSRSAEDNSDSDSESRKKRLCYLEPNCCCRLPRCHSCCPCNSELPRHRECPCTQDTCVERTKALPCESFTECHITDIHCPCKSPSCYNKCCICPRKNIVNFTYREHSSPCYRSICQELHREEQIGLYRFNGVESRVKESSFPSRSFSSHGCLNNQQKQPCVDCRCPKRTSDESSCLSQTLSTHASQVKKSTQKSLNRTKGRQKKRKSRMSSSCSLDYQKKSPVNFPCHSSSNHRYQNCMTTTESARKDYSKSPLCRSPCSDKINFSSSSGFSLSSNQTSKNHIKQSCRRLYSYNKPSRCNSCSTCMSEANSSLSSISASSVLHSRSARTDTSGIKHKERKGFHSGPHIHTCSPKRNLSSSSTISRNPSLNVRQNKWHEDGSCSLSKEAKRTGSCKSPDISRCPDKSIHSRRLSSSSLVRSCSGKQYDSNCPCKTCSRSMVQKLSRKQSRVSKCPDKSYIPCTSCSSSESLTCSRKRYDVSKCPKMSNRPCTSCISSVMKTRNLEMSGENILLPSQGNERSCSLASPRSSRSLLYENMRPHRCSSRSVLGVKGATGSCNETKHMRDGASKKTSVIQSHNGSGSLLYENMRPHRCSSRSVLGVKGATGSCNETKHMRDGASEKTSVIQSHNGSGSLLYENMQPHQCSSRSVLGIKRPASSCKGTSYLHDEDSETAWFNLSTDSIGVVLCENVQTHRCSSPSLPGVKKPHIPCGDSSDPQDRCSEKINAPLSEARRPTTPCKYFSRLQRQWEEMTSSLKNRNSLKRQYKPIDCSAPQETCNSSQREALSPASHMYSSSESESKISKSLMSTADLYKEPPCTWLCPCSSPVSVNKHRSHSEDSSSAKRQDKTVSRQCSACSQSSSCSEEASHQTQNSERSDGSEHVTNYLDRCKSSNKCPLSCRCKKCQSPHPTRTPQNTPRLLSTPICGLQDSRRTGPQVHAMIDSGQRCGSYTCRNACSKNKDCDERAGYLSRTAPTYLPNCRNAFETTKRRYQFKDHLYGDPVMKAETMKTINKYGLDGEMQRGMSRREALDIGITRGHDCPRNRSNIVSRLNAEQSTRNELSKGFENTTETQSTRISNGDFHDRQSCMSECKKLYELSSFIKRQLGCCKDICKCSNAYKTDEQKMPNFSVVSINLHLDEATTSIRRKREYKERKICKGSSSSVFKKRRKRGHGSLGKKGKMFTSQSRSCSREGTKRSRCKGKFKYGRSKSRSKSSSGRDLLKRKLRRYGKESRFTSYSQSRSSSCECIKRPRRNEKMKYGKSKSRSKSSSGCGPSKRKLRRCGRGSRSTSGSQSKSSSPREQQSRHFRRSKHRERGSRSTSKSIFSCRNSERSPCSCQSNRSVSFSSDLSSSPEKKRPGRIPRHRKKHKNSSSPRCSSPRTGSSRRRSRNRRKKSRSRSSSRNSFKGHSSSSSVKFSDSVQSGSDSGTKRPKSITHSRKIRKMQRKHRRQARREKAAKSKSDSNLCKPVSNIGIQWKLNEQKERLLELENQIDHDIVKGLCTDYDYLKKNQYNESCDFLARKQGGLVKPHSGSSHQTAVASSESHELSAARVSWFRNMRCNKVIPKKSFKSMTCCEKLSNRNCTDQGRCEKIPEDDIKTRHCLELYRQKNNKSWLNHEIPPEKSYNKMKCCVSLSHDDCRTGRYFGRYCRSMHCCEILPESRGKHLPCCVFPSDRKDGQSCEMFPEKNCVCKKQCRLCSYCTRNKPCQCINCKQSYRDCTSFRRAADIEKDCVRKSAINSSPNSRHVKCLSCLPREELSRKRCTDLGISSRPLSYTQCCTSCARMKYRGDDQMRDGMNPGDFPSKRTRFSSLNCCSTRGSTYTSKNYKSPPSIISSLCEETFRIKSCSNLDKTTDHVSCSKSKLCQRPKTNCLSNLPNSLTPDYFHRERPEISNADIVSPSRNICRPSCRTHVPYLRRVEPNKHQNRYVSVCKPQTFDEIQHNELTQTLGLNSSVQQISIGQSIPDVGKFETNSANILPQSASSLRNDFKKRAYLNTEHKDNTVAYVLDETKASPQRKVFEHTAHEPENEPADIKTNRESKPLTKPQAATERKYRTGTARRDTRQEIKDQSNKINGRSSTPKTSRAAEKPQSESFQKLSEDTSDFTLVTPLDSTNTSQYSDTRLSSSTSATKRGA